MPRVRLTLAYVGTDFHGWQIQERRLGKSPRTVQGELEAALRLLLGLPVRVHGAGRTDAGVHADMQTAHFDAPEHCSGINWPLALQAKLPPDISVLEVSVVEDDFHSRLSSLGKIYTYALCLDRRLTPPRLKPFVWNTGPLDLSLMDEAARAFPGWHDFAALRNSGSPPGDTVRRVYSVRRFPLFPGPSLPPGQESWYWAWEFIGNGFLKQMARNMMGFLVAVGRGSLSVREAERLFSSGERAGLPFPTAPARGLTLSRVIFPALGGGTLIHQSAKREHIRDKAGGEGRLPARPGQSPREPSPAVGKQAEAFAGRFRAAPWGRALGTPHDIGKAQAESEGNGAGKLLAYCIAGHHAGLPDGKANKESSLRRGLDPELCGIEDYPAWRDCLGADMCAYPGPRLPFAPPKNHPGFSLAFFVRMLFSCLVDADRLDAEKAGNGPGDAPPPFRVYPGISDLRARLDIFLREKKAAAKAGPVNRLRAEVLEHCLEAAKLAPGLFSLTAPAGGGKTLSSLAFALAHAESHGLDRVVYVTPCTDVIEQNAGGFRQALGDGEGSFVIEHHSNLVLPEENDDSPHPAAENWDAPVIVTTAAQFFESLFSAGAGHCRKLHNLAKSVVVLDEAQMLPLPYLRPCVEAIRELSANYGASVVLCTATRPALNAPRETPGNGGEGLENGLAGVREIIPDPKAPHAELKRVEIRHVGELPDAALVERLAAEPCVLCIVPTRRMAGKIFAALRGRAAPEQKAPREEGIFHLSALMCPEHRTRTLDAIRASLKTRGNGGRPCRLISTALVEAGVDLDFPVVYRAEAGMDSLARVAGLCNREGEKEKGRVYVFRPECGLPPGLWRQAAQAARSVAERHKADLLHPDAARDYFLELYWRSGEDRLDAGKILSRLDRAANSLDFPFREIEKDFRFIDVQTQSVIIPYDEKAGELLRALESPEEGDNAAGDLLRRLQRYGVSLHARDFIALESVGAIRRAGPRGQVAVLCDDKLYDAACGLDPYRAYPAATAPEDLYF
jgi:CRISPR-associated endonuclease/helicase Cas3